MWRYEIHHVLEMEGEMEVKKVVRVVEAGE
jgi:hypothetical protein